MNIRFGIYIILALTSIGVSCKKTPKEKTVFIEGQKIETTETEVTSSRTTSLKNLTDKQVQQIQLDIEKAKRFAKKYATGNEPVLTSRNLDAVLKGWQINQSSEKESEALVIALIGSAFGQNIVDNLGCEWKVLSDEYGSDLTVIHKDYWVNGFPYSSVKKVIVEEGEKSLEGIELLLKSKIQEAKNEMNIDSRTN